MHDLDRTMFEMAQGGELEAGGSALEQEDFFEVLGEFPGEVPELDGEGAYETAGGDRETLETELALELLEVTDEQELDRFLRDLVTRAAGAARRFASSPTGQALGGIVKDAVGKALPVVGRAVGNWAAPGYGDVGARVGKATGSLLGLELEGLSHEDRELETARALVRWALEAAKRAAAAPAPATPVQAVRTAGTAATAAAQRHAPGLVPVVARTATAIAGQTAGQPAGGAQSGRWVRRGNAVVLLGL